MNSGAVPAQLHELAAEFADDLTTRVQRIIPTDERFTALAIGQDHRAFVGVGVFTGEEFMPLRLMIKDAHRSRPPDPATPSGRGSRRAEC
ncbi:hypothetical protein GCM10009835_03520 [Planosporangium flavigriseum]|uniref:Uncharacterized protein n=1 Tax=Planosporangium flavigriseum TaxID=373681 RepID=A0A8J3PN50_9ACTN|nr:hypothetical protein Pfl04_19900 [Planosporangium flavigriseum]